MFLKIKYGETIIKLKYENQTLAELQSKIKSSFTIPQPGKVQLSYLDGDGDYISIPAQEDLEIAIQEHRQAVSKAGGSILTLLVNYNNQKDGKKMTEDMLLGLMQSGGPSKTSPQKPGSKKSSDSKRSPQVQGTLQVSNTGKSPLFTGALPPPIINVSIPPQAPTQLIQYAPPVPQYYPVMTQNVVYPPWRPPKPVVYHPCKPYPHMVQLCWRCRSITGSTTLKILPGYQAALNKFAKCKECWEKIRQALSNQFPAYPHKYIVPCCR